MAERQTETLTDRHSQTFTIEIASSQFKIRTLLSNSNLQGQEHFIGYHRVIQNQTLRKAVIARVNAIKLFSIFLLVGQISQSVCPYHTFLVESNACRLGQELTLMGRLLSYLWILVDLAREAYLGQKR
jgi:hypothetical protein